MRLRTGLFCIAIGLAAFALAASGSRAGDSDKPAVPGPKSGEPVNFSQQVVPLLAKYCTRCHGGTRPRAGLSLDAFKDEPVALKNPQIWDMIAQLLRSSEMPP